MDIYIYMYIYIISIDAEVSRSRDWGLRIWGLCCRVWGSLSLGYF